jgi:hypothetical protein
MTFQTASKTKKGWKFAESTSMRHMRHLFRGLGYKIEGVLKAAQADNLKC